MVVSAGSHLRVLLGSVATATAWCLLLTVAGLVLPPALLVAVPTAFLTFLASQTALGPHGVELSHPGALRAVLGACLHLTLMCLFSLGIATMLRSTALSLSLLFAFTFVLSPVANTIPALRTAACYLPDHAGAEVMKADPGPSPGTGLLVLAAWATAALLAGYLTLRGRDG
ncbi:hypothetical protein ACWCXH_23975 [Kitasatospora sp. NPDC001660]